MFTFAFLEGTKQRTWEFAGHEVNYLSIQVMASVVSLIIALCISVFMEGKWVPSLVRGRKPLSLSVYRRTPSPSSRSLLANRVYTFSLSSSS